MGMMKEHVRGTTKCCETIASDILLKTRAEDLVYHPRFHSIDLEIKERDQEDSHGGFSPSRVLGGPASKADMDVLERLLKDALLGITRGWE